jgi:peptidoglycan/LPS O-acetylase OafA/YrhL
VGAEKPEWRIGRRPALDGLRGVAVLLVVADHAGFLPEPAGSIGVTVFFVLSGFLITRVIVEARQTGSWSMPRFAADRFVRLFPALLVMVLSVSILLLAEGFPAQVVVDRAVPALTYVQNMAPTKRFPVFGHTWSLGVEEQFYLLWPLALPWVVRRSRPLLAVVALIAGSATVAIMVPGDWLPMHGYGLLCGCALAIAGPPETRRWLLPVGTLGLVGAIAVAPHLPRIYVYGPLLATLPAMVLVTGAAASSSSILEQPLLRFTGRTSYALYLWHVPLMRVSRTTYHGHVSLPWIALSAVLAVGSTLMLEEPLRRRWRRASAAPQHHRADRTLRQWRSTGGHSTARSTDCLRQVPGNDASSRP